MKELAPDGPGSLPREALWGGEGCLQMPLRPLMPLCADRSLHRNQGSVYEMPWWRWWWQCSRLAAPKRW